MPSMLHEVMIDMVRQRPVLAPDLMEGPLKASMPSFRQVRPSPGDFTAIAPTEYRADQVVALYDDADWAARRRCW